MNSQAAIKACFSKYATFSGRATRPEFWWFYLFTLALSWGATIVGNSSEPGLGVVTSLIVSLAVALPTLAAGCRRLHDIGRSGWWQLLILTGIGIILLVYWWARPSQDSANAYGEPCMTESRIPQPQ